MTLHEAVRSSGVTNIELVDIAFGDQPVSLLRFKEMPEFAFLVWVNCPAPTSGKHTLTFKGVEGEFRIVCLCCCCKGSGIQKPASGEKDKEHSEWAKMGRAELKKVLVPVCKDKGIQTIFFRHAEFWTESLETEGINGVEADRYEDAMLELHGRKIVKNAFGDFVNTGISLGSW